MAGIIFCLDNIGMEFVFTFSKHSLMFYFQSFSLSIQHFIASDFWHVATVLGSFDRFLPKKSNIEGSREPQLLEAGGAGK